MPAAIAISTPREAPVPRRASQAATPPDSMAALDHVGAVITLRRDEALFLAGDKADFYFKILKGAVRSCKLLDDGRRHIGDFYLAGDFIGLDAGETYSAAAEAVTETALIRYARRKVDALAAEQPRVAQSLIEIMRLRLIAARERMVLLGHMTAMERIASFLLGLANRASEGRVSLPMTRTDIGDYLGLTMETVSRALSQLRNSGIVVQRSMHELVLVDRNALLALIRC
ncbi:MAG TPA: helix-turn-helix domain-containing protein [Stellaceae bacterium]|jgi:CRP/FNR family nitrogen fixation transcriptional regulator